ncbi:MAG: hypothetical protein J6M53_01520, partial [Bacteroidaceae bacterium]|nr:hypothetical protein [Bacteroidaceae bacterium]
TLQGGNHIYWNGVESVTLPDDCQFREIALGSNSSVTLKPGKMYSKSGLEPPYALADFIYEDGTWGEPRNHPNGKQGVARVVKLGAFEDCDDYERGYTHGYAFALEALGPTAWQTNYADELYFPDVQQELNENGSLAAPASYSGLYQTDYLCTLGAGYGDAAKLARSYGDACALPSSKYSSWFLPSLKLLSTYRERFPNSAYPASPTMVNSQRGYYNFWTVTEFFVRKQNVSQNMRAYFLLSDDSASYSDFAIDANARSKKFLVLPFIAF